VREQLGVTGAGVFQGVGQDGEAGGVQRSSGHLSSFVDCFGKAAHGSVVPRKDGGRRGWRGAERVAEYVTTDGTQISPFCYP
jgi:hypothetical protein